MHEKKRSEGQCPEASSRNSSTSTKDQTSTPRSRHSTTVPILLTTVEAKAPDLSTTSIISKASRRSRSPEPRSKHTTATVTSVMADLISPAKNPPNRTTFLVLKPSRASRANRTFSNSALPNLTSQLAASASTSVVLSRSRTCCHLMHRQTF